MARQGRQIVGIDLGTSKVAVIVGEPAGPGEVEIIGLGVAESRGIRRGAVINMEAAVESIRRAVIHAESTAGIEIDRVRVSLSGTHIKGFNSCGGIAPAGTGGEITDDDVRRAVDAAQAVRLPDGRNILHVLLQDFVVDQSDRTRTPVGMHGSWLEANVHIVTVGSTTISGMVACVNRAGLDVQEVVLGSLAASKAVLTSNEKELGVALLDIGAGTTDIAIFERGYLVHTSVVPIGGDHLTNDIAVGLRMSLPDAEALKRSFGCTPSVAVGVDAVSEPIAVGRQLSRPIARRTVAEGLQSRAVEILRLVGDEISRAGYEQALNSGIVLTGGSANLAGLTDVAEQVLDMPVRRGVPCPIGRFADKVQDPSLATAVGLLLQ